MQPWTIGMGNELRNLEWWHNANIIELTKIPVRTYENAPKDIEAALEEAKLAVLCYVAKNPGDEAGWKLRMLADRFLYARPRKPAEEGVSNAEHARTTLTERLKQFWGGD